MIAAEAAIATATVIGDQALFTTADDSTDVQLFVVALSAIISY